MIRKVGIRVAMALVATSLAVSMAQAVSATTSIRPQAITLTPDPPGLTGTLADIISTPGNEILGADDRGLFKWTAAGGWKLILEPATTSSCRLTSTRKRCYDDPIAAGWGYPDTFELGGGRFFVVYPMGVNGNLAINVSDAGKMTQDWTTVHVSDLGYVQYVCAGDLAPSLSLYATVYDRNDNPIIYESNDSGMNWIRSELSDAPCFFPEVSWPTVEEIVNAPGNPQPLGYFGDSVQGYVETPQVRMVLGYGGVFASTDGGNSWIPQSRGIPVHPRLRLPYTSFGDTKIAGGMSEQESALFRSVDGGATFRRVGGVPYAQPFEYVHLVSETVAFGSYRWSDLEGVHYGPKIFVTNNRGGSWTPLNDGEITFEQVGFAGQFEVLITTTETPGRIIAIMRSTLDELFISTSLDNGASWDAQTQISGCNPHQGESFANGDLILVPATGVVDGVTKYGYCRSTDGGESFSFVPITTNRSFNPGNFLFQPSDGSMLLISPNFVPFVSSDNGATFTWKACSEVTQSVGQVESGTWDSTGALWVVRFDPSGATLPGTFRSPDGGCTWDETSISYSLDDDVEDNVLEIDPDVGLVTDGVSAQGTTGSRNVRIIGVGAKGSIKTNVYWGSVPSPPRKPTAATGGRKLVITFMAPTVKGPGTVKYTSQCKSPGKRTSTVTNALLVHTHTNLVAGAAYTCTIVAINPIGPSSTASVSKKVS